MTALKRPIAIYHEHPHWFERLFAELDRRGTPYERVDATRHFFDIEPNGNRRYSLVFNRMSPSAYTRGHGHGIYYTVSYLEHLERLGVRVINGSRGFRNGLFAAAGVVGVYFFAQSMVVQIVRVVTLNLSGVLLPALNRITNDPQRQANAFLRAARVLTLIGAPLCVGLGATGSLFVRVFLDAHKWDALPPVLGMLALGTVFRLADEPVQSLMSAQGRFSLGFRLSLGTGVLYVTACTIGSMTGRPVFVATAAACYYAVVGPLILYVAIRMGGGRLSDALRVFWTPFLLAVAAIAPWLLLDRWLPGHGRARDCMVLAAVVAGSAGSYLLLGRILQPAGWRELLEQVHNRVPGRLKRLVARVGGGIPLGHPSVIRG